MSGLAIVSPHYNGTLDCICQDTKLHVYVACLVTATHPGKQEANCAHACIKNMFILVRFAFC